MNANDLDDEQSPDDNSQRSTELFLLLAVVIIPLCMWAISQGIPGVVGVYAFGLLPQVIGLISTAVQAALLIVLLWIGLRQPLLGGRASSAILAIGFVLLVEPAIVISFAAIEWGSPSNFFFDSALFLEVVISDVVGSIAIVIGLLLVRSFTRLRVCHRSDMNDPVLRPTSIARLFVWTTLLAVQFSFLRLPWARFNQVTGADVRPGYELVATTLLFVSSALLWTAPLLAYVALRDRHRLWQVIGYVVTYSLMHFLYIQILYFCYPYFQLGTSFLGTISEILLYGAPFWIGLLVGTIVFERLGFRVVRCQIQTQAAGTQG